MVECWEYGAEEKEAYTKYKKEALGNYIKNVYERVKSHSINDIGKYRIRDSVKNMNFEAMQLIYLLNDHAVDCELKLDLNMTLDEAIKAI